MSEEKKQDQPVEETPNFNQKVQSPKPKPSTEEILTKNTSNFAAFKGIPGVPPILLR